MVDAERRQGVDHGVDHRRQARGFIPDEVGCVIRRRMPARRSMGIDYRRLPVPRIDHVGHDRVPKYAARARNANAPGGPP